MGSLPSRASFHPACDRDGGTSCDENAQHRGGLGQDASMERQRVVPLAGKKLQIQFTSEVRVVKWQLRTARGG